MKDKLYRWLAAHMPRRLIYLVVIRAWADFTAANERASVSRTTVHALAKSLEAA